MPMFPAVNYTGARWGSRFFSLWALSGPYRGQARAGSALRYHRRDEMGPAESFVFDAGVSDMLRDPPHLLFVMTRPNGTLPHADFDYVTYFSQDPRFARIMGDYMLIERVGDYQVLRRAGRASVRGASRPATASATGRGPARRAAP